MTGFVHGSKAGVRMGTAATPTTKVDVSQYFSSESFPQIRDTAETTTFGKLSKTYIPGLRDATLSGEGKWATPIDTQLSALFTTDALIGFDYAPAGLGVTGTPLYSGFLFVTSYETSSDVGDATTFSAEFQVSGDVTRTIQ